MMEHDWKELTKDEKEALELRGLLRRCSRCGLTVGTEMKASDGDCDSVIVRGVQES